MRLKRVVLFPLIIELQGTASWIFGRSRPTSPLRLPYQRRKPLLSLSKPPIEDTDREPPRLVILIPAYNEENRIESTLKCYQDFLLHSLSDDTDTVCLLFREPEIVVVDDGSLDATIKVVQNFPAKIPIRTIALEENSGKGAALARGIQDILESSDTSSAESDRGDTYILTQDADGSGDLIYLNGMLNKLRKLSSCDNNTTTITTNGATGQGLVIGNRNYDLFTSRGITRWGFQTCVRIITSNMLRVKDSQCGYKLMTLKTAKVLYENLYLKGWSHDVEVLFRANLLNIPIDETRIELVFKCFLILYAYDGIIQSLNLGKWTCK
jgi:dolichyl-phosphate beta-glucosyltransferase